MSVGEAEDPAEACGCGGPHQILIVPLDEAAARKISVAAELLSAGGSGCGHSMKVSARTISFLEDREDEIRSTRCHSCSPVASPNASAVCACVFEKSYEKINYYPPGLADIYIRTMSPQCGGIFRVWAV